MSNEEKINMLLDADFNKCELVINRIYKEQYVKDLEQENQQLRQVLDEIRECTRKYCSGIITDDGEIVFVTPTANIVQILDKVKE